jgi:hypothetical protein
MLYCKKKFKGLVGNLIRVKSEKIFCAENFLTRMLCRSPFGLRSNLTNTDIHKT